MLYSLDLDSLPLPPARKIGIMDLPVGLLTNKILPFCEVRDMLSLGCTNRFFALIMSDGMFWRQKLVTDYNFTGSETNRASGWKFIYLKSRKPRLFTWGSVTFLPRSVTGVSTHSHIHPIITIQNDPPIRAREFSGGGTFGYPPAVRNSLEEWKFQEWKFCKFGGEQVVSAAPIPIPQNGSHTLSFL